MIVVLIALVAGGTLIWELAHDQYAQTAREIAESAHSAEIVCDQIAELVGAFPTSEAHHSRGDAQAGRNAVDQGHPGCRVDLSAHDVAMIDGNWADPVPIATGYRFQAECFRLAAESPRDW